MSARAPYPNAQIFAIGSMTAAQLEQVCKENNFEAVREPSGNFRVEPAAVREAGREPGRVIGDMPAAAAGPDLPEAA